MLEACGLALGAFLAWRLKLGAWCLGLPPLGAWGLLRGTADVCPFYLLKFINSSESFVHSLLAAVDPDAMVHRIETHMH